MPAQPRSPEQLRHHYEVERELAGKMRASSREKRTELFQTLYTELFERVPDHPRLTRRETPEQSRINVEKQFRLIAPHLEENMTFLEIAPGDCRLSLEATQHCAKVIGVDISDQRDPEETFPDNFELIVYDGYDLSQIPDSSVDIIFSYQFLEHLHPDDVPLHFDLARRLLKPGGLYILDTPHRYSGPHDISRFFGNQLNCFHFQEWTIGQLKQTLRTHGFDQCWVYRFRKVQKNLLFNLATSVTETVIGILPHSLRQKISLKLFPAVTLMAEKNPPPQMTWSKFRQLVKADLFRYEGRSGIGHLWRMYLLEPGFRITFLMRLSAFTRSLRSTRLGIYHLCRLLHHLNSVRYGVYIDFTMDAGGGLYIPHPCSIIINRRCKIGDNCNISQNVTIGISNRGSRKGCPTIGNRVYIGTGAVIYGRLTISDDAAIGANCVVNRDVPAHCVFAGIPGKVVSDKGSTEYINQTLSDKQN